MVPPCMKISEFGYLFIYININGACVCDNKSVIVGLLMSLKKKLLLRDLNFHTVFSHNNLSYKYGKFMESHAVILK